MKGGLVDLFDLLSWAAASLMILTAALQALVVLQAAIEARKPKPQTTKRSTQEAQEPFRKGTSEAKCF